VQLTVGAASAASAAVAVYVTVAPVAESASIVLSSGSDSVGAIVSVTVTAKLEVAWLPAASAAVQSTVVTPTGNVEPDAGRHETVGEPSARSVAVAA
jgi:hypothetical protein